MELTKKIEKEILDHAKSCADRECCGLIVRVGRKTVYMPSENAAKDSENFEIPAQDWIKAEEQGEVVAVVHSHPNGEPFLSGADRQMQVALGLPWVLAANGVLKVFQPCEHLRGRKFIYGKFDCASLVRDAYMLAGIYLPDYDRADVDADARNGVLKHSLQDAGFVAVADSLGNLVQGDVVLTTHGGVVSHAMIYLGNNCFLHHALGQLSGREDATEYWRDKIACILRHPEWKPEMIQAWENDFNHLAKL